MFNELMNERMKELKIMKTNIFKNMKQFAKYICAVVLMLGMNVSAWGAIYIEYDGNKYYNGNTITINVDLVSSWASSVDAMTIKNDGDGWSISTYYRGYIHAAISGTYVYSNIAFGMAGIEGANGTPYWEDEDHYTSFYEWNNWQYETISFYTSYAFDAEGTYNSTITILQKDDNDVSTLQSAAITVSYVVTAACTPNDVVYGHSGTGGDDPTGDDAACEDATVNFTPDPSTGYAYSGATVYLSDMETVHASLNASTTSFTMPDEDVYVVATYAPIDYTISFNANGGTGSMDDVVRAYNTTYNLPACTFTAPDGKVFDGWAEGSAEGTVRAVGYSHTVTGNITFYAKWRAVSYTDAKFSCADWTLTGPSGDIVFITSAANKTVRSQEAFHVSGSGLPHETALTFTISPASVSSKFAIKKADGTVPETDEYGVVDADVYVYYTPGVGDTSDGLDEFSNLTVSVEGEPRTATIDTKRVIGRHLPADFVIAAKKNGKWWALPSNMTTGTPAPAEIAVDDFNNPSIAYTATTNIYSLYDQADGRAVKLAMHGQSDAPLYGSTGTGTGIGKSSATIVTNPQSNDYLWLLTQINTSITNPQDAKYNMTCENSNTKTVSIKDNPVQWGLYSGGTEELRLIPASDIAFTEASVVEWGQHSAIVEVDATGIDATSVVAYLGEATSSAIELVQTKSSVKNGNTKYNYTVNFGDGIDFAAAASNGAMLTLEWKKSETVKAMSNIIVPKIIATSATMSSLMATDAPWSTAEVHVLPGVTLEANAGDFSSKDVVINQLEIYPGATVKVTKGAQDVGTLKVKTLVLRNGWTRVGEKAYDVARLYVPTDANLAKSAGGDVWYSDWYIDYDQYYPIAVPFPVATSSIVYKNTSSAASAGVKLRYYSGELRAAHIQENQADNWVEYTWGGTMPTNLEPSKGYIMTAKRPTGKAFSIVRMPLTFTNAWTTSGEQGSIEVDEVTIHKDQVTVTAWGVKDGSTTAYAEGWNMIANPYMALHQGELTYTSGGTIEYANIPNITFTEYDQLPIETTKLKPSSAFLVQAPKDGTVTFGATNRQASAPSYRQEIQAETYPRQKAYIVLANDEAEDMMGIWISDKYNAEYEINADLEKLLGDGKSLRTYMHFDDMKMAYLAINKELAQNWIPVSVRIEKEGEHSFSMHRASTVSELKGVYLIDYQTGETTNLLEDSYPFYSTAGTINGRFAINAIVGPRDVPTELDIVRDGQEGTGPIKFIYHDKVFILHQGVIYDSTGKKVREIKK